MQRSESPGWGRGEERILKSTYCLLLLFLLEVLKMKRGRGEKERS